MNGKLRVVVVDDEPLARRRVVRLLRREDDAEVVAVCANGHEAVQAIRDRRPDLVFLDVQMPELDGFGVVREVGPERMPAVVFVTAYDQYALQAFEVHALDYLLKPFDEERMHRAYVHARSQVERRPLSAAPGADGGGEGQEGRLVSLMEEVHGGQKEIGDRLAETQRPYMEWVMVRSQGSVHFLRTAEVQWIEAEGNYVRLHVGARKYLIREKMGALEGKLDPARFLRVHRSTIVNLEQIRELRPWFSGDYIVALKDGTELRLSRSYRDKLGERVGEYM